jgi:predicted negative regulator of RcsB-dependent stress response
VDSYRTEEEQLEALKRWWQENGRSTVIGIVLAVSLVLGWQGWQKSREASAAAASALYQQMLQALSEETAQGNSLGLEMAAQLKNEYPGSTYAQFAALYLARAAVGTGDSETAESELRWALGKADGRIREIAQLRLAKVLADRGETERALELLAASPDLALGAAYAMARGDVLLAAGRPDEARLAYEAAAGELGAEQSLPTLLADKIDYLNPRPPSRPEAE